jgi:putative ABC transport system ATP-binding protein
MTNAMLIELESVYKRYMLGDVELPVLRGITLQIHKGESVAIMGSSGSGKSTLMNILGCLDRPTSGRYWLDSREVSLLQRGELAEVRNRTIGFVFQNFNLLARTSALENVELPLIYAGLKTKERTHRAKEALSRVGLENRMDHHPSQLSGGQQQRVAIARALVTNPKLILADEPTGNLDSHTTVEIMALFQELGKTGITLVLVTHEPDVASYAKRVILLKDGQIIRDETHEPVAAVPSNARPAPEVRTA